MSDLLTIYKESKSIGTKQQVADQLAQQQSRYLRHPTRTAGECHGKKSTTTRSLVASLVVTSLPE